MKQRIRSRPWRSALVIAALLLLAPAGGCGPTSEMGLRNVQTVTPGVLIRGGQPDEAGFVALREKYGIRSVINLNDQTAHSEAAVVGRLGLTYVALPSDPFRPDAATLRAFLHAVDQAEKPVYVHCRAGMDRTGVAVAVYRMIELGWTMRAARAELWKYQAWPHTAVFWAIPGFLKTVDRGRSAWANPSQTRPATRPAPLPASDCCE